MSQPRPPDMLPGVASLPPAQAYTAVLHALGISAPVLEPAVAGNSVVPARVPLETLCAEIVRATLWALSGAGRPAQDMARAALPRTQEPPAAGAARLTPVHTLRLLSQVHRMVEPLLPIFKDTSDPATLGFPHQDARFSSDQPGLDQDPLRAVVEELEELGDIAALPHGRWVPAPLRAVPLSATNRWLLVGGCPTHALPAALQEALEYTGPARMLRDDPAALGAALPVQPEADWCRLPGEDLAGWTRHVMASVQIRPAEDAERLLECYAPGVPGLPGFWSTVQLRRWTLRVDRLPHGRYLVRQRRPFGYSYAIAQVVGGTVVGLGELPPGERDVRRLQYGCDLLAGKPVRARVHQHADGTYEVRLGNELPGAERRLFTALGRLLPNENGKYYPRRWKIDATCAQQAVRVLRRLGIQVVGVAEFLQRDGAQEHAGP